MKQTMLALLVAALFFTACTNEKKTDKEGGDKKETVSSDTKMDEKAAKDPCAGFVADSAQQPMDSAMMATWMAAATPGEMHKMLAMSDGEWDGEVTSWMDPAAPPTKSKSWSMNKMVLGGRFQHSETSGCFGGMPFEGMGLVGYDNIKKVFMSTWIDNMGTTMMNLEGPYDPTTKTIHLSGTCTNPMDGKQMRMREDFTITDDNNQLMVMYGPDMKGKEFKTMEIKFTRKK
jgi:hypothetical protein